jgi:hypothetical protein
MERTMRSVYRLVRRLLELVGELERRTSLVRRPATKRD